MKTVQQQSQDARKASVATARQTQDGYLVASLDEAGDRHFSAAIERILAERESLRSPKPLPQD